jgi:transcriptional regulator with XRE-family HTH domain
MKFGAVLQACRERAGISQEELAHQMNRSQSCISKFEKDIKIPDTATFMQWIHITNTPEVAIAFLLGMDGITMIQQLMPMITGFVGCF